MAISDLTYMHAAGDGGPRTRTQVVVIHATDNTAPASGEAGYATRRPDKTSAHFYIDDNVAIRALPLGNIAYGCLYHGNQISVQIELCGRSNAITDATMRKAAPIVAELCRQYGLPVAKVSGAQVAAGHKGICGHLDITHAFPQDGGDHSDPGTRFDWARFIGYVQQAANPTTLSTANSAEPVEEDTMPFAVNIALPVNVGDTADVTIPPSNLGYFAGFKAYFKLVVDEDTPALYRVALLDGIGGTVDRVSRKGSKDAAYNLVLGKGRRKWESGDIPDGTCLVKMERLPSGDTAADGKPRHLTLCVEYGRTG